MLALVILVIIGGSYAALDPNCTAVDPAAGALVLTPAAIACNDKASTATCTQFFTGPAAVIGTDASADRINTCYQDTAGAPSPDIKKAAVDLCPKFCGFCCVTPEYNCANAPAPRINCGSITRDMCTSPQWRDLIAQDCPSACGFCLLGGCIDAAPDCATQPTICGNTGLASFTQTNCRRTCGLCNTAAATTAAPGTGTGTCGNTNANCANWVRNGFCTSTFYTTAQKQQYCGSSCGLCAGK